MKHPAITTRRPPRPPVMASPPPAIGNGASTSEDSWRTSSRTWPRSIGAMGCPRRPRMAPPPGVGAAAAAASPVAAASASTA